MAKTIAKALVVLLFCGGVLFGGFQWFVNRVYVPEGESLLLRYKGPLIFGARNEATPGHFAEEPLKHLSACVVKLTRAKHILRYNSRVLSFQKPM